VGASEQLACSLPCRLTAHQTCQCGPAAGRHSQGGGAVTHQGLNSTVSSSAMVVWHRARDCSRWARSGQDSGLVGTHTLSLARAHKRQRTQLHDGTQQRAWAPNIERPHSSPGVQDRGSSCRSHRTASRGTGT
jgi:hypothetical protein